MATLNASQEVQQSAQFRALDAYFTGKSAGIGEAVQEFCAPVEQHADGNADEEKLEEQLRISWQAVTTKAAATPFSDSGLQKLADFVVQVQARPGVQREGRTVKVHDAALWHELPVFGWQVREAWNADSSDDNDDAESRDHWININAFSAILAAKAHASTNDQPDLSLFALWTLRTALEESDSPANVSLSAAAVWFIHAAPALWDFAQQKKSFQGKIAAPGSLKSEAGWTGYSGERWQSWSEALSKGKSSSDSQTAQLVEKALAAISKVSGHQGQN